MVNIKDVRKRLIENPEPEIVTDIRNNIINKFSNLQFVADTHQYFLPEEDGSLKELMSVSHTTGQFQEKQDWDMIAEAYAIKNGLTKEAVQEMWYYNNVRATNSGTGAHLYGEAWMDFLLGKEEFDPATALQYEGGYLLPHSGKEEAIANFNEAMFRIDNLYPILAETRVHTGFAKKKFKQGFAGTFDMLFYYQNKKDDDKSGLVIQDYKGLPLDTPLLTTSGWKTMGTVSKNDEVFDKHGIISRVKNTSEIHFNPCYKITFNDGEEIIADHEHRWLITYSKGGNLVDEVLTTEQISDTNILITKPKIKINKKLKTDEKELPIDPYVLGLLLGGEYNQSMFGNVLNKSDEFYKQLKMLGYNINEIKKIKLVDNHIPVEYLLSSYEQRLSLLRGIMDINGYYNKRNNNYVFHINNEIYLNNFITLISSLGIKTNTSKIRQGYNVEFVTDVYPFLINIFQVSKRIKKEKFRTIEKVELVDTIPTRCIEVDNDSSTFLVGHNLLVTHNTNADLYKNFKGQTLLPPFDDLLDEAFSLYTLQLSSYQIPLEDIGYKIIGRRIVWVKDDGTYEILPVQDVSQRIRDVLTK